MARFGLVRQASTTNWRSLRRTRHCCEPAASRSPPWSNPSSNRCVHPNAKPSLRLTAQLDLRRLIHGAAILLFDHGDKVAGRLAVKVAVRRHARTNGLCERSNGLGAVSRS